MLYISVDPTKPVVERDVFILRLCDATWCAVFRHAQSATVTAPGPTEVCIYVAVTITSKHIFTTTILTVLGCL